jgi:hypothetical protein
MPVPCLAGLEEFRGFCCSRAQHLHIGHYRLQPALRSQRDARNPGQQHKDRRQPPTTTDAVYPVTPRSPSPGGGLAQRAIDGAEV